MDNLVGYLGFSLFDFEGKLHINTYDEGSPKLISILKKHLLGIYMLGQNNGAQLNEQSKHA